MPERGGTVLPSPMAKRKVGIGRYTPKPMFNRRLRALYILIACSAALTLYSIVSMRFVVTPAAMSVFAMPIYLVLSGMLARRIGQPTLADILEGLGLTYGQGLILMFMLFPLTALSGTYVDKELASLDRLIGFDWHRYLEFCRPFTDPLVLAYNSYAWQPALVVLVLVLSTQQLRLRRFLTSTFVTAAVTALVFPFAPAVSPFAYYGITTSEFPELTAPQTRDFLGIMEAIRGGERIISPEVFTGVVAFPSFHAAMAALFTWAAWPSRWMRWPVALLNAGMLAATPVIGNHYLVDVLAGLLVASCSITLAKRIMPE